MSEVQLGRDHLARFIVNGTYSGPTHAIAASLIVERQDDLHMYVVDDPTGGPEVEAYLFHYFTLIDALDRLASIGGERIGVGSDGLIVFVPDF